jgi:hypothetical protein
VVVSRRAACEEVRRPASEIEEEALARELVTVAVEALVAEPVGQLPRLAGKGHDHGIQALTEGLRPARATVDPPRRRPGRRGSAPLRRERERPCV